MYSISDFAEVPGIQIGPVEALRHPYRRGVLFALLSHNPRDLDELPSAALRRGGDDGEDIHRELNETHLPILDEAGFIDWDRDSGKVTKGDRFEEIAAVLKAMGD